MAFFVNYSLDSLLVLEDFLMSNITEHKEGTARVSLRDREGIQDRSVGVLIPSKIRTFRTLNGC